MDMPMGPISIKRLGASKPPMRAWCVRRDTTNTLMTRKKKRVRPNKARMASVMSRRMDEFTKYGSRFAPVAAATIGGTTGISHAARVCSKDFSRRKKSTIGTASTENKEATQPINQIALLSAMANDA
ncbi:hypothetical protein AYW79_01705 [Ferroacidibacillus organovorans]|uniref:Uncharacterized protein n=1 Tax=Ferroacidibacillus organovorans TaxID=1765683 RepID=A0A853KFW9_9BACL|nr:hypothetical protein AYJ22_01105 [Ferroacidibacillus organovorans]OAG95179.1 hypothetical protein AYW79_01705 [Ferroacidibacillus organovorans]